MEHSNMTFSRMTFSQVKQQNNTSQNDNWQNDTRWLTLIRTVNRMTLDKMTIVIRRKSSNDTRHTAEWQLAERYLAEWQFTKWHSVEWHKLFDTQRNNSQQNDIQQNSIYTRIDTALCWMSLCSVSFWWMSRRSTEAFNYNWPLQVNFDLEVSRGSLTYTLRFVFNFPLFV